jgi:hypothetical protein
MRTYLKDVEKDFYVIGIENPTLGSIELTVTGGSEAEAEFVNNLLAEQMHALSVAIRKFRRVNGKVDSHA